MVTRLRDQGLDSQSALDPPRHLIIRPRMRTIFVQLVAGFMMFCCTAAILQWIHHDMGGILWTLGIAFFASVVAHIIWFRCNAPRAIVATDEFLGITTHGGDEQRIPWSSIFHAAHSTKSLGMKWDLDSIPAGPVVLRDIGIDAARWGTFVPS